jgi:hypothetical protein
MLIASKSLNAGAIADYGLVSNHWCQPPSLQSLETLVDSRVGVIRFLAPTNNRIWYKETRFLRETAFL